MTDRPAYLTLAEAATELRVSRSTISRLVREGLLPSVQVGRLRRIRRRDIEAYGQPPAQGQGAAPKQQRRRRTAAPLSADEITAFWRDARGAGFTTEQVVVGFLGGQQLRDCTRETVLSAWEQFRTPADTETPSEEV